MPPTDSLTILLPTSIPLNPLPVPGTTYLSYDPLEPLPQELCDADALVVWGNARRHLADCATRLHRLRWVQTLAAGPDEVLAAGFAPSVTITCGRGLHDIPVSEHTLALALAAVRRLPVALRAQAEHHWASELGWQSASLPAAPALTSLLGARVLMWGFGSIAQHLAPMLSALGADVTGVATSAGERAGYEVVTDRDVPAHLPHTDVLIGLLPATPLTARTLDAAVFEALPDHAWVVNVGRGATLDEAALIAALEAGRLGGAALDVFETEPLPADSPLWDLPNVIITPHAAGGRPLGAEARIARNAAALLAGGPLEAVVPRA